MIPITLIHTSKKKRKYAMNVVNKIRHHQGRNRVLNESSECLDLVLCHLLVFRPNSTPLIWRYLFVFTYQAISVPKTEGCASVRHYGKAGHSQSQALSIITPHRYSPQKAEPPQQLANMQVILSPHKLSLP